MNKLFFSLSLVSLFGVLTASVNTADAQTGRPSAMSSAAVNLPAPDLAASKVKFSKVIGWPEGKTPQAPEGFKVSVFATNIKNPRNIYVAPNGDILAVLSNSERTAKEKVVDALSGKAKSEQGGESANTVVLFRDKDHDGKPELQTAFLTGLNQPYGILIIGSTLYVANTDGVYTYPYTTGATQITGKGKKIVELPAGGYNNHWTRNLIASPDNKKIYISVGSGTNVAEHGIANEHRRANLLEINPDGSGEKIYAAGLRNPVGLAWAPVSHVLWTAVNERDGLGDNLVPDYVTGVQRGAFYGWPYSYFGQHEDPRLAGQNPALVKSAIAPDIAVGAHTASLGLAFYTGKKFPAKYLNGLFIGQHGSWNRSELSGYKVAFVPFKNGKQAGPLEDFLTGFIADVDKGEVYGRPVGIAVTPDGSMLVADDVSNTIWRVSKI
jgi:glucose/arabinose dehydrogenase